MSDAEGRVQAAKDKVAKVRAEAPDYPDSPEQVAEQKAIAEMLRAPQVRAVMAAFRERENAPRTTCPECHFESSKGYDSSHAPGCSQVMTPASTPSGGAA